MLKIFRVNNFKSLLNLDWRPTGLNLLVGRNNAGKTNLCQAIRFLGLSSLTSLQDAAFGAVGENWNLTNVSTDSTRMEFFAACDLNVRDEALSFKYQLVLEVQTEATAGRQNLRLREETLKVSGTNFKGIDLITNEKGQARLLHEERFVKERFVRNDQQYVETLAPEDATMLSRLYELKDNPRATAFKHYLHTWLYYNLSPESLRSPDVIRDYDFIRHDGANLSRALFALHNEKPRVERAIIEALRLVEPKIDLFSYKSPDPDHVYVFLEDRAGHRFGTRNMSDGTLRFLAMSYLFAAVAQTSNERGLRPLVVIEEPENGLYVGQLKPLLERIDPTGAAGQFIFTSHNPYFIDLFDKNVEGVFALKPGVPSSVLVTLDKDKVFKVLEEMPLGEAYFHSLLE